MAEDFHVKIVIVPLEVDEALREQFKKLEDQAIKEGDAPEKTSRRNFGYEV
jgi:hypothetical protein